jgi:hypothetical protein
MRAIEFKSKILENKILIPQKMQQEFTNGSNQSVRVVVFVDDSDVSDEQAYRKFAKSQFLKGYADSDSIYDEH